MSGRGTTPTTIFWGVSVFVYHLERRNGMGQNSGQQQNFAHAITWLMAYAASMDLPDDSCVFFMCSFERSYWNIPGTCFDIYAVTGTAWNSRIKNSFATGEFSIWAFPGGILSVPTGVVLHR